MDKDKRRAGQFPTLLTLLLAGSLAANVILYVNRGEQPAQPLAAAQQQSSTPTTASGSNKQCHPQTHFVPPRVRTMLGAMLQNLGMRTGVELGVQKGEFARVTLDQWPSCEKYYLVDAWRHQANYHDWANVPQEVQDLHLNECKKNLEAFKSKTVYVRNFTSDAVKLIPDQLDYIYVDARHDYCGVAEDIALYWPKLRAGGIMAGHDYLDAIQVKAETGQDWSVCSDGSKHDGGVKQAVDDFAKKMGLAVFVTYQDPLWSSWIIVKPSQ